MNPQLSSKDASKQLEYVKQQQQLRAFDNFRNGASFKTLSAESMIEDLLSKKETFQKRTPEAQPKQDIPAWLTGTVPPLYERVWAGVQAAGGLADTPLLSTLLMSSGLPTDTLGYIWSLANRTVSGALTKSELYLVLALVGLAQTGYVVNNLTVLHQFPQAPVPTLDLTLLPTRVAVSQVYPTPLNVTSLPDPTPTFNWTSAEKAFPDGSEKIGISYVSSGPMVSPTLITDQISKAPNFNLTDLNSQDNITGYKNVASGSSAFDTKSNTHMKHSNNAYSFSFPSLNESPSHVANEKPEESDPFDDEFTDFQSADFTSVNTSRQVENNLNSVIDDEDEFSNFQKASPKYDSDDLSVLVVGGKNIPSAQTLWVADSPTVSSELKGFNKTEVERGVISNLSGPIETNEPINSMKHDSVPKQKDSFENKYLAFQEIEDDKYSVFHNPLPDEEDKQSVISGCASENLQAEPSSIFSHSLFEDPDASLSFFKVDQQTVNFEPTKATNSDSNSINSVSKESEEFSNFQNFPVNFPDMGNEEQVDKYNVFRTIVFEDNSFNPDSVQKTKVDVPAETNFQSFQVDMDAFNDDHQHQNKELNVFNITTEKQTDDIKFGDFQNSTMLPNSGHSIIDNLFSSLAISEKMIEKDVKPETSLAMDPTEDKYKALRLLEPETVETDEFGEFFGAELPNSENQPRKDADQPSIQPRCLEACLNLLKAGLTTMSRASSQDVVSEILSDPRGNNYLDCLLEVHRMSERIISHLDSDCCVTTVTELRNVWDGLAPFFTHMEHMHLTETVGAVCGVCRSDTGPSPVTFGAHTFHTPCANLYLHCVEPVLPNIAAATVQ